MNNAYLFFSFIALFNSTSSSPQSVPILVSSYLLPAFLDTVYILFLSSFYHSLKTDTVATLRADDFLSGSKDEKNSFIVLDFCRFRAGQPGYVLDFLAILSFFISILKLYRYFPFFFTIYLSFPLFPPFFFFYKYCLFSLSSFFSKRYFFSFSFLRFLHILFFFVY
ncbi:unnamed protein product [Acanthosepion pharaonis]|uniref:Uncharacterized protein n=1 Tax=Acanthosepion pharaonis TaxID=158019 RepID=A0A812EWV0_ACAPH|nr:unnamed protein product [Sepia pharaonis]